MPRTYILLECDGPDAATEAEAVGAVTGVLAQHGALGVHQTSRGDFTVALLAGSTAPDVEVRDATALHLMQALRGLAFDVNRTATPFDAPRPRQAIGIDDFTVELIPHLEIRDVREAQC